MLAARACVSEIIFLTFYFLFVNVFVMFFFIANFLSFVLVGYIFGEKKGVPVF